MHLASVRPAIAGGVHTDVSVVPGLHLQLLCELAPPLMLVSGEGST